MTGHGDALMAEYAALAKKTGMKFHLDGARLFNGAAALGVVVCLVAALMDPLRRPSETLEDELLKRRILCHVFAEVRCFRQRLQVLGCCERVRTLG